MAEVDLSLPYPDKRPESDESLSQLTSGLRDENHDTRLKTVKLINDFVKNSPLSDGVRSLTRLRRVTHDLKFYFCDNIAKIEVCLKQPTCDSNSTAELLRENIDAISCLHDFAVQLKPNFRHVNIENVDDILTDVVNVLFAAFEHCRKNEARYETLPDITALAAAIFRKCNELQTTYLEFLTILQTNDSEEQIRSLVSILNKTVEVGVIVFDLEMKTMVQLWKGFVTALKIHSASLRGQFDVSKVVGFFCTQIRLKMADSYREAEKSRTLTLKILGFLLKIVVKICEYFVDCLERCCATLYELVLGLFQNSKNCALLSGENVDVAAEIETCLLAGVDPLVATLVNDRGFARYFLERKQRSAAGVPVLLFLSTVLQKLSLSSPDVQSFWFENSVLDCVLGLVSEYAEELCYEVIVTAPISPQLPQEIFLYDALVVYLSNLIICGLTSEEFYRLEELLMHNLLKPSLVTKLFVSDLWCVVIRYGSTELRYKHVEYLVTALDSVQNEKPETVFLISLVKRLFGCLSRNQQFKIVDLVKHRHDLLMELCSGDVPVPQDVAESALRRISDPMRGSLTDVDVMTSVAVISGTEIVTWNKIDAFVIDSWRRVAEDVDAATFVDFMPYLCYVSTRRKIQNIDVIRNIEEIIAFESIFAVLNILEYLRSLGRCVFADDEHEFCRALASIFKTLLKNSNTIIRQKTLETFSYFSHVTKYEKIIEMAIANDVAVAETMADYLQCKSPETPVSRTYGEFLRDLFRSKPVPADQPELLIGQAELARADQSEPVRVDQSELIEVIDPVARPSKKLKLQIDFENDVYKIESTALNLLHSLDDGEPLDPDQKRSLTKMLDTVDKLRTFLR